MSVARLMLPILVTIGAACGGAQPSPPAQPEPAPAPQPEPTAALAPSLRSYFSAAELAMLGQSDASTGCAAARDAYDHGSAQALDGTTYLETYHRAADENARACTRYPAASPELDCCVRGFTAGGAAMASLFERWTADDFQPLDGGHTRAQVRAVGGCVGDLYRGRQFAFLLCGATGPSEPGRPHCPLFERAEQLEHGLLGCWSLGFNQRLAVCSQGRIYREREASRRDCERPASP